MKKKEEESEGSRRRRRRKRKIRGRRRMREGEGSDERRGRYAVEGRSLEDLWGILSLGLVIWSP